MNFRDIDFGFFYKEKFDTVDSLKKGTTYDYFISALNQSERVQLVFEAVNAKNKHWLILPEYGYDLDELPQEKDNVKNFSLEGDEGEIIRNYFEEAQIKANDHLCIDITGFMRPHLLFLVMFLYSKGFKKVDFLYSDPDKYKKKEETDFSFQNIDVRQISGYQGSHKTDTSNDLLVIASGYDNQRITDVAKDKARARKIQIFGLPSLQPDMFQENVLRAYKAEEDTRSKLIDPDNSLFAPANDPFETANILKDFLIKDNNQKPITNLYLSPLSTKAQTLGFALFYIASCIGDSTSVIFPICSRYSQETSEGMVKVWRYTVEFDYFR